MRWSGFQGGPGLTVFHFGVPDLSTFGVEESNNAVSKVDAFRQSLVAQLPYGVSLTTDPDVEALDVATGSLQAIYSTSPAAASVSTQGQSQPWTAAQGAVITWKTNTIKNRRRMRGRSFLVPMAISITEMNGTLAPGFATGLNASAAALRAPTGSTRLFVYARPVKDFTIPGTDVSYTFAGGKAGEVIGHSVPDTVAVLRSRRD